MGNMLIDKPDTIDIIIKSDGICDLINRQNQKEIPTEDMYFFTTFFHTC